MLHRDKIIIQKVLAEIKIGFEMMGDIGLEGFLQDEKLKRAISMTVINIGELVKNISDETRKEYAEVPWKEVAGMRDIAAHKYQTLRMEDVYYTVSRDFTMLEEQLERIVKKKLNLGNSI